MITLNLEKAFWLQRREDIGKVKSAGGCRIWGREMVPWTKMSVSRDRQVSAIEAQLIDL